MSSTEFSLPNVDDPASVEGGVILMGLEADRLLAGLGLASIADDPTTVALVVDQVRHGAASAITADALLELGCGRWSAARPALAAAARTIADSASLRVLWARVMQAVEGAELGGTGPASRAYLAACWLRRYEVDRYLEDQRAVPEVTAG